MIGRRGFLAGTAAFAALAAPLGRAFASAPLKRSLRLVNVHTDESLDVTYYDDGVYDYEALEKLYRLLRCHHTDEVKPIDIRLFDLLCDIRDRAAYSHEIEIISGYRSAEYNDFLRRRSRRVARDSYHLYGLAVDFAMPGVRNRDIWHLARSFYAGGVGGYRSFVHVDVGPVRYW
ncbi:MAG: DUF882 domain-containing protein [Thermodesulfovibrionales bacterium]